MRVKILGFECKADGSGFVQVVIVDARDLPIGNSMNRIPIFPKDDINSVESLMGILRKRLGALQEIKDRFAVIADAQGEILDLEETNG